MDKIQDNLLSIVAAILAGAIAFFGFTLINVVSDMSEMQEQLDAVSEVVSNIEYQRFQSQMSEDKKTVDADKGASTLDDFRKIQGGSLQKEPGRFVSDSTKTVETWYSMRLFSFDAIPDHDKWVPDDEGFMRDEDGYYLIAGPTADGTIMETSKGAARCIDTNGGIYYGDEENPYTLVNFVVNW